MYERMSLALFYHHESCKWFYNPSGQVKNKQQILYWGALEIPIKMSLFSDSPPLQNVVPLKAMVTTVGRPVLGPLIGILSAQYPDGSLKGNFSNYKSIMEAGQKLGGIVFAFTPSNINWSKKVIYGNIFNTHNRQWVPCTFPFPNVVYNRIQDRKHENREESQLCIRRFLSHRGVTLYNPGFFNKEEVIKTLSKSPKVGEHIPEMVRLLSKTDLTDMLDRYQALYLKPVNNRLGKGIMRVKHSQSHKPFVMHYYAEGKKLMKFCTGSIHELWEKILQHMDGSPYIIQQAIPLAVISKCPFDCRVLIQKNYQGLWRISGLGIRVAAQPQSITTHVPRGGHIANPERVFQQAFPHLATDRIIRRIMRLCIAVAKSLEKHYRLLGEISIDVGLDNKAHPWVFEANAKPMRFDEPEIRKNQLEQVIRYAQFLTFKAT